MDLFGAIHGRRAVRDYTPEEVGEDMLRGVIDAAIQAPSSMNRQPWSFAIVNNRTVLEHCSKEAKKLALATMHANAHLASVRDRLASPDFNIFYNAPALVVIAATERDSMARQDCCLAAGNLMLAAHGYGLGTCWIGFAEAWLNEPEGRSVLMLPASQVPVAPIIIGHPRGGNPVAPARRQPHITWIEG